ncbi:MAG: hypothetical protein LBT16_10270 [Treponema sp.]|nr:hypothetical protein [Treponema sp.]
MLLKRKNWKFLGGGAFRVLAAVLLVSILAFTGCSTTEDEDDPPKPPVTWTAVTGSPFEELTVYKVAYGNKVYVATGGSSNAWYSSDGVTWAASTDKAALMPRDPTTDNISGLGFGGGKFLAVGGSGSNKARAYTTDGKTWVDSGANDDTNGGFNAKAVAYGNGIYVIGGSSGRIAYTDKPEDGTSWTILAKEVTKFEGANGFINGLTFGGSKFLAAGGAPGDAAYSADGKVWTDIPQIGNIFGSAWINGAAYGGNKYVIVGEGTGIAAYSSDCVNWTQVTYGENNTLGQELLGVAYGNGYFVAVGNAGGAWYSADGVTWIAIEDTTFGSDGINGVVYGDGKFIMVGNKGKAAYAVVK